MDCFFLKKLAPKSIISDKVSKYSTFQPDNFPISRCLSVTSSRNAENIPSQDHMYVTGIISSHAGWMQQGAGKKKKTVKCRRCGDDVSEVFPSIISGLPPLHFPRVNPVISATQLQRAAGGLGGVLGARSSP